jgi:hypothetical protein
MASPSRIDPPDYVLQAASFAESIARRHAEAPQSSKFATDLFVAYAGLVAARDKKLAGDCLIALDEALSSGAQRGE